MFEEVEAFQARYAELMMAGDIERILTLYRPPLPVFFPGGLKVDATYSRIYENVKKQLEEAKKLGITRYEYEIFDIKKLREADVFSYSSEIQLYDDQGGLVTRGRNRRFLERMENGLVITLVEVIELAVPIDFVETMARTH